MKRVDLGHTDGPLSLGPHGEICFYEQTPFAQRRRVSERMDAYCVDGYRFSVPAGESTIYVVQGEGARSYHFQEGKWFFTDEDRKRLAMHPERGWCGFQCVPLRPFEPEWKPFISIGILWIQASGPFTLESTMNSKPLPALRYSEMVG